ncbi:hypothetical protein BC628DRAFT_548101 [Trametes gibbosa]|nr:hypothetical protein BC628DRAFT_548101 [Trametes gibbosa]
MLREEQADIDPPNLNLSRQYSICDLFDFDNPVWIKIEGFASLGLNQELELYEILDFDATGDDVDVAPNSEITSSLTDDGLEGGGEGSGEGDEIDLDDVTTDVLYSMTWPRVCSTY